MFLLSSPYQEKPHVCPSADKQSFPWEEGGRACRDSTWGIVELALPVLGLWLYEHLGGRKCLFRVRGRLCFFDSLLSRCPPELRKLSESQLLSPAADGSVAEGG